MYALAHGDHNRTAYGEQSFCLRALWFFKWLGLNLASSSSFNSCRFELRIYCHLYPVRCFTSINVHHTSHARKVSNPNPVPNTIPGMTRVMPGRCPAPTLNPILFRKVSNPNPEPDTRSTSPDTCQHTRKILMAVASIPKSARTTAQHKFVSIAPWTVREPVCDRYHINAYLLSCCTSSPTRY